MAMMLNNKQYDTLDAILLDNRVFVILKNEDSIVDLKFAEKATIDGKTRYFLPPSGNLSVENMPSSSLARARDHYVVDNMVKNLKSMIAHGQINTIEELTDIVKQIKSFIYTDLTLKSLVENDNYLNYMNFDKKVNDASNYLNSQINSLAKSEDNHMVKQSDVLNYDWLYNLDSDSLKELAKDKGRTSEELIYILDALNKREESEKSLATYTQRGKVKTKKIDRSAAFIDAMLLSLIVGSFGTILILTLF